MLLLSHRGRLRELRPFILKKRRLRKLSSLKHTLKSVHKNTKWEWQEDGSRTRGDAHTLKSRRFPLNISKHFPCESNLAEHRLPRQVEDAPSLEVLESYLGVILDIWLWLTLPELGNLKRTLPISNTPCVQVLPESHIKISQWISLGLIGKWTKKNLSRTIWVAKMVWFALEE